MKALNNSTPKTIAKSSTEGPYTGCPDYRQLRGIKIIERGKIWREHGDSIPQPSAMKSDHRKVK
jgi:hypothetical protein